MIGKVCKSVGWLVPFFSKVCVGFFLKNQDSLWPAAHEKKKIFVVDRQTENAFQT